MWARCGGRSVSVQWRTPLRDSAGAVNSKVCRSVGSAKKERKQPRPIEEKVAGKTKMDRIRSERPFVVVTGTELKARGFEIVEVEGVRSGAGFLMAGLVLSRRR
jgi:hypothetical protein